MKIVTRITLLLGVLMAAGANAPLQQECLGELHNYYKELESLNRPPCLCHDKSTRGALLVDALGEHIGGTSIAQPNYPYYRPLANTIATKLQINPDEVDAYIAYTRQLVQALAEEKPALITEAQAAVADFPDQLKWILAPLVMTILADMKSEFVQLVGLAVLTDGQINTEQLRDLFKRLRRYMVD